VLILLFGWGGFSFCFTLSNIHFVLLYIFFFWWDCDLNSGFHACRAGTLLLEQHLQSLRSGHVFGDGGL
jgi:hypothetical protein